MVPRLTFMRPLLFLLSCSVFVPRMATADDSIDDLFDVDGDDEDEDEDERNEDPVMDDEAPDAEDPDDDEWDIPDTEGESLEFDEDEFGDELDADVNQVVQAEGEDTARVYREYLESMEDLGPDEEALSWERYLKKYPKSIFRSRIEERMDELAGQMYDQDIFQDQTGRLVDAGSAELNFTQPMLLENIDPRSKLRAGFEWGYPSYINLMADLEHQIFRELSVHGGLRNRYTGWNLETGAKYALIKSARTQMLVTAMADLHVNLLPFHPGVRPQVGVGKRFDLGPKGKLEVSGQTGGDLLFLTSSSGSGMTSIRWIGGANVTYAPSKEVRIYFETSSYMKDIGASDVNTFRFNVVSFGIKFIKRKGMNTDKYETGVGTSVPYTSNYWGYHYGSVLADINYYL